MREGLSRRPPSVRPQAGMWPKKSAPARPLFPQVVELIAIIGFVFIAYHGVFWYWEKSAPREVSVPKIIGMTEAEADKVLAAAGLRSEIVGRKSDEEIPDGSILAADPPAGRQVRVGRLVRLTASTGSRWAIVPDVREMSVDRARALLRQENLEIGKETARYDNEIPVGYVIGHAPSPEQKVPRGTPVDLLVSKGPAPQRVAPEEPDAGVHRGEIVYNVPPGANLQEVRIVVSDRNGERTVYRGIHRPGETVKESVSGEGPTKVRLYLSGLLVEERTI
jgi:hypothetical protein